MVALDEARHELAVGRREARALQELRERNVVLRLRRTGEDALDALPEVGALAELAALAPFVAVREAVDEYARAAGEAEDFVDGAVHELGAELDRHGEVRLVERVHAAAEARARFEEEDIEAGGGEVARRGEAGGAAADDDRVALRHGRFTVASLSGRLTS